MLQSAPTVAPASTCANAQTRVPGPTEPSTSAAGCTYASLTASRLPLGEAREQSAEERAVLGGERAHQRHESGVDDDPDQDEEQEPDSVGQEGDDAAHDRGR